MQRLSTSDYRGWPGKEEEEEGYPLYVPYTFIVLFPSDPIFGIFTQPSCDESSIASVRDLLPVQLWGFWKVCSWRTSKVRVM